MTHGQLCLAAYLTFTSTISKAPETPSCYRPMAWLDLDQVTRAAFVGAVLTVQRCRTASPKREAYKTYREVLSALPGKNPSWEDLIPALKRAWGAFTDFVIKEGQLN